MRFVQWASAIVLGMIVAAVVWWSYLTRPNNRELTLPDGTRVFGLLAPKDPASGTPMLVSLRLADAQPGAALRSTARLHLRGRDFVLRDLSPSDLRALGIEVSPTEAGSTDDHEAYVDYGAENELGGIEFGFAKGKLRAFFARCHVPGACEFELSWPGHGRFQLPISERRLLSAVEQPVSVRDYFAF
jgi:hypothetical protein